MEMEVSENVMEKGHSFTLGGGIQILGLGEFCVQQFQTYLQQVFLVKCQCYGRREVENDD